VFLAVLACAFTGQAWARVHVAGPSDYRQQLEALEPGDTLALNPGIYRQGLPVHNIRGTAEQPIHIAGPERGRPAVFLGRKGHNTVSIVNSAYVTIRSLEIDGQGKQADGVKAEGHADFAHHITLSDLYIHNLGDHQQTVGISTKSPAWGWVVRDNVIERAGTGMYFGDPNGKAPFFDSTIEYNLVTDPIGYALQIKHEKQRPHVDGMPEEPSTTRIRHNVFAKGENSSTGGYARPNVLIGHFPPSGRGADDRYVVYGNLFYRNPTERLFQGEGTIALYDNLFVNPEGGGVAFMPHKGDPRRIWMFHNTVLAKGTGLFFKASDRTRTRVVSANAIFADKPVSGNGTDGSGNLLASYEAADKHLQAPFAEPGALNLVPTDGGLRNKADPPVGLMWELPEARVDFDGRPRTGEYFGAYVGGRAAPDWLPALEIRPRIEGSGN
jgi:hypothetical protein